MTIQDLIDYCMARKYPLSARLVVDIEDGDDFDVSIAGLHGHGHDEPETVILNLEASK